MEKIMRYNKVFVILGFLLVSLLVFKQVVGGATEEEEQDQFLDYLMRVDNVPSEIERGLFLGSFGAATNIRVLKALNITHVLTVADSLPSVFPNSFVYKTIRVEDSPGVDLSHFFQESFAFIDEARMNGGSVLVHCLAGISRSATTVVAYIMKEHSMSLSDALDHVAMRRPVISPNPGFMRQLVEFEKSLEGSSRSVRTDL